MSRKTRIIFSHRSMAVSCPLILQHMLGACVLLINAILQKHPGLLIGKQLMPQTEHVLKHSHVACEEKRLPKCI